MHAAAPELLEACKDALKTIRNTVRLETERDASIDDQVTVKILMAAIAKADVKPSGGRMSYAPSPWRIAGRFDADATVSIVYGEGGWTICTLEPPIEVWQPDEIANARLIAAAPELLEALKTLLIEIKSTGDLNTYNASRAIAKAEGRS